MLMTSCPEGRAHSGMQKLAMVCAKYVVLGRLDRIGPALDFTFEEGRLEGDPPGACPLLEVGLVSDDDCAKHPAYVDVRVVVGSLSLWATARVRRADGGHLFGRDSAQSARDGFENACGRLNATMDPSWAEWLFPLLSDREADECPKRNSKPSAPEKALAKTGTRVPVGQDGIAAPAMRFGDVESDPELRFEVLSAVWRHAPGGHEPSMSPSMVLAKRFGGLWNGYVSIVARLRKCGWIEADDQERPRAKLTEDGENEWKRLGKELGLECEAG
jgi:hypothetical protein